MLPEGSVEGSPIVERALPTEPVVRGSASLFLTEAAGQGVTGGRKMLYVGLEPATDRVARALGVEPGSDVLARRKLLSVNAVPVRIATSYLRADLFAGTALAGEDFLEPSLQEAIEALGYRFGHAEERLIARPSTPSEARTLRTDPAEWVVQILRVSFNRDGTPVHALETICAASRHVFPVRQFPGSDEF
jgi:DNA-binding GntR family transcriptional regulator